MSTRVVIIAWHGNVEEGFYVVPEDKAYAFLAQFNNMEPPYERSPWEVVKTSGPHFFLPMEGR